MTDEEQVQAYLKIRFARQAERDELMGGLLDDVNAAAEIMIERNTPQLTRAFALSVARALDGIFTILRQEILEDIRMNATKDPFSISEIVLLQGRSFDIKQNGKPTQKAAKTPFESHILFVLRCLAKAYGIRRDDLIDPSSRDHIKETISIRNRVVHPKKVNDLEILERDIETLRGCVRWLFQLIDKRATASMKHWANQQNTLHIPGNRELAFFEIDGNLTDPDSV